MAEKKIVLVLGNPLNHEGGVVEFNRGLIKKINEIGQEYSLEPFVIGSRMYLFYRPTIKRLLYPFYLFFDLIRLVSRASRDDVAIIQVNPSLILVPILRDGLVLIINRFFIKKKIVVVFHGWREGFLDKSKGNKLLYLFLKYSLQFADQFFVLSEKFKNDLVRFGVDQRKISVTTTFFQAPDIQKYSAYQQSNDLHSRDIVQLLFLGRVSRLKGVDDLIDALSIVARENDGFYCKIVGHGDKPGVLEDYKSLVEKKNMGNLVTIPGRIDGLAKFDLYKNADIFILPSYTEGCPTAVIEALASGMFVISTDVGALDDLICSDNGMKFTPGDVNSLAGAIKYCLKSIDEIRSCKDQIAASSMSKYEVGSVAGKFLAVYKLLDGKND